MATHLAAIKWAAKEKRRGVPQGPLLSRAHTVSFDGGTEVPASASPHVVGKWAVEAAVDPEEMLVASLSSCHMLSFLHLARVAGFTVRSYEDHAVGNDRRNCAWTAGGDPGEAPAENRVGGRFSREGGARSPAPRGPRHLLHRQFGEDAGHRGVERVPAPRVGAVNRKSAPLADAVVDLVILLLDLAIERALARTLGVCLAAERSRRSTS